MSDYRDLCIETYGDENAELSARAADLELQRDTLLVYLKVALHQLHRLTTQAQHRRDDEARQRQADVDAIALLIDENHHLERQAQELEAQLRGVRAA